MKKFGYFIVLIVGLGLVVGCGDEESGPCSTGDKKCSGQQIQLCTDGVWGEAESCPSNESCHDMAGDTVDHCMAMEMN